MFGTQCPWLWRDAVWPILEKAIKVVKTCISHGETRHDCWRARGIDLAEGQIDGFVEGRGLLLGDYSVFQFKRLVNLKFLELEEECMLVKSLWVGMDRPVNVVFRNFFRI